MGDKPVLAGMALTNGVIVIGPNCWSVAIRSHSGEVRAVAGRRIGANLAGSLRSRPLVGGVVAIADLLSTLPRIKMAMPEAKLPFENPTVVASLISGAVFRSALRRSEIGGVREEALQGLAGGALAVVPLAGDSSLTRYHGAEHKAIAGHEQNLPSTMASRIHRRCGTNLLLPLVAMTTLCSVTAVRLFPNNQVQARNIARWIALVMTLELERGRQRGKRWLSPVTQFGDWMQRNVTTSEPDLAELEVADTAVEELLRAETALQDQRADEVEVVDS